jgi:hypothetical protein
LAAWAAANILVDEPIGPDMGVELCDMASLVQLPCESISMRAKLVKSTAMTRTGNSTVE